MKQNLIKQIVRITLILLVGFGLGIVASWQAVSGQANSFSTQFFSSLYWGGYTRSYPAPAPPGNILEDLLWETYATLKDRYLAPDELDEEELLYGAIRGLTRAAGDPYTSFFTPDEAKQFLEDASGHFEGIGAEIGIRNGFLTVISPLNGSPASAAGLLAGDIIIEIDEMETGPMSLEEAVSRIRGRATTRVVLTIFREGESESQDVAIIRARIDIPTLEFTQLDNGIVRLELFTFSEDATFRFRERVGDIVTQATTGMILDLRNNPGGFLDVSIEIASLFLDDGAPVVIERQRDLEDVVSRANGNGPLRDVELVVLVNGGSASAAEILAGALRDNKGTLLIGEMTFGKGTVQEFPRLSGGAALKVTVGEWLTPNETSLRDGGLEVDIEVTDDPETPEDEVLNAAIRQLLGQE